MTVPEALKARVIMKNNDLKTFPETSTQRRQRELNNSGFTPYKLSEVNKGDSALQPNRATDAVVLSVSFKCSHFSVGPEVQSGLG